MFFTLAGNDSGGPIAFYAPSGAISAWQTIWNNTSTNQYIYLFGDSQETIPSGLGLSYIPNLNYQFFKRFGKAKFMLNNLMGQNAGPTWLANNRAPGSGTTGFAANELPPGMNTVSRLTGTGTVTMIDHLGTNYPAGCGIPVQEYWDPSQPFYVDVYARSRPSSKEFNWAFTKQSGSAPSFSGTVVSSGVSSMGLNAAVSLKTATFGPFTNGDYVNNPYSSFQMYTTGTPGDGNDPDIYAVQIRSAASTGGINIHSFSVGGYKVTDFMANHASSGPVLASLPAPVALMFHYSTNDLYNSVSAATVAANYRTLINTLRGAGWFNNSSLPCVIMIDPPRTQVADTAAQIEQHALLKYELMNLADNDGKILVIDGKSAVEQTTGWYRGSATAADYLVDNVHYTANGGRVLAEKEWSQISYAGNGAPPLAAQKFMLPVRFNNPASNKPYITLTNITGLVDGKKGTFYMSMKLLAGNGNDLSIMRQNGGTQRFYVYRATNNTIQIVGISAASATVLSLATLSAYTDASGWINILGSWDLATGFASIYVNETVGNTVTATNADINYTAGDDPVTIGQLTSSLVLQNPDMEVGTIFMDYANSIDITNSTNRRKFYTAGGVPVFIGNRGEIPLGAVPHICLYRNSADSLANFANNRGSGGTATLVNSLVNASSTPL